MDVLSIILAVIVVILTTVVVYLIYNAHQFRMFAKQGIPYIPPTPVFGSGIEIGKDGFINFHHKYYYKFGGEKVYGYFEAGQPVIAIRDLDMLRDIMVKNFHCFVDRRVFTAEEPLKSSLTNLQGDHWRHVRNTVSPTFTTGKLKRMSTHLEATSRALRDNLFASYGSSQDLKEIMSRFAMDAIASTGFGVNADSLNDPSSPFAGEAKKMLDFGSGLLILFVILFPKVFQMLSKFGIGFFPKEPIRFFTSFVDAALENRVQSEENGKGRNDFIQLVVEEGKKEEAGKKGLSLLDFHGQAFIFILAGYDTVSTTLAFMFFLLAYNPLVTKKLQEEIDESLNGEFPTYESVQSMEYLDKCVYECMRMYPAAFVLDRACTEDCVIQGISIKKGTYVVFPLMEIYHDPNYFPEPEKFDPERHSPENKESRHPFAFLPFGQGPRNCIGSRLALLEVKMAIAGVLQDLTPVPCEKSVYPPKLDKFQLKAEDGLWAKFVKRGEE